MSIDLTLDPSATIDSERWPAVARVPGGPVSAATGAIADRLFRRAAARLPIRVVYPDGTVVGAADPTLPTMVVHRPEAMVRRVGRYGLIGFGESYMAGDWSSTDIAGLLTEFGKRLTELIPPVLQRFRPLAVVRQPRSQHNSLRAGAAQHRRTLRPVQRHVRRIPRRDDDVLQRAVRRHCPPTSRLSPTHSAERSTDSSIPRQSGRAVECSRSVPAGANCASAPRCGAPTSVRSPCRPSSSDWPVNGWPKRACPTESKSTCATTATSKASYDAVLSIEMVEAVGYRFWPKYFQTLDRLVTPGWTGRDTGHHHAAQPDAGQSQHPHLDPEVHLSRRPAAVDRGDHRHHRVQYAAAHGRHVLPATALRRDTADCGGSVSSTAGIPWQELGFDEVFQRMWELYLAYSEAGFRSGYLDVYQWTFAPSGHQQ